MRRVTLNIGTLFLLATSAGGQSRDSAGIRIVESPAPKLTGASVWRLSTTPTLDVGGGNPGDANDFDAGIPVLVLSDDRLVWVHSPLGEIRIHTPDGKLLTKTGRRGEGPNEFRYPKILLGRADTVLVYDPLLRRLTRVAPNGKISKMEPMNLEMSWNGYGGGMAVEPMGAFNDGSLAFTSWPLMSKGAPDTYHRDSLYVVRFDGVARKYAPLVRTGGFEMYQAPWKPRQAIWIAYMKHTEVAIRQDRIFVARNDRWEVEEYNSAGRLLRLVRLPVPLRPVTDAFIEAKRKSAKLPENWERYPATLKAEYLESQKHPLAHSANFPPIASLLLAPDSTLYVMESEEGLPSNRVAVFDPQGVFLCRLTLPAEFKPLAASRQRLFGFREDADGIRHLIGYSIIRP